MTKRVVFLKCIDLWLYMEKDSNMEAMADDLATLALDMLMDKEGKERGTPNLFFHSGVVTQKL